MKEALPSLAAGASLHIREPKGLCCSWSQFLGQEVGRKKKFTKSLFVNGSQESHLILLFSTGIENISSFYPTHSFTIFSNHDQNDLFYNYTVT